jgi:hypothetical protein
MFILTGIYAFYFMEMLFNLLSKNNHSDDDHGHSHLHSLDKIELHTGVRTNQGQGRI